MKIVMEGYRCERCGHAWVPRRETKPRVCPGCKSPYWDLERNVKRVDEVVEVEKPQEVVR